ncbi:MAG: hypothetical protein ACR2HD_01925 [Solirubrobacteraceae bacterium]|nr:MAG: hypothetical protein DLM63_13585 [Solirubrobacterales bacterium]
MNATYADRDWQEPNWHTLRAPLIAAVLALTAVLVSWRGVDLPAAIYRVGLFHRDGLTLWDSQWYGGHWTLNYSALFPPLAGVLGLGLTEILSAATAAWAFDRLVIGHFGRAARAGSLIFAVGTLATVAIGQLPFLLGEALALCAYLAATRRRWSLGIALALASSLASPLAGAFLVLAAFAWLITSWPRRRLAAGGLIAGAIIPGAVVGALFPGQGFMPFPATDFIYLAALCIGVLALVVWRGERSLRNAALLYIAAVVLAFALPTPMGGNISRLGECLGAPLAACVLWPRSRRLAAAVAVPLALLQWTPALATFTSDRADPSTHIEYFAPLLGYLAAHDQPAARVEIVPTKLHWEAAYVAPSMPLARGWERQLDTADNPLFYTPGALTTSSYQSWLVSNAVRYVAVPDVALDYAAVAEGDLIRRGVPGLRLAWHDAHWQVYRVIGAPGIVDGAARLVALDGHGMTLDASGPGTALVRIRYTPRWTITQGQGCVRQGPGDTTAVQTLEPGALRLAPELAHPDDSC